PKTGGRRPLDIVAPPALPVAPITMGFLVTWGARRWAVGFSTGTDTKTNMMSGNAIGALNPAIGAAPACGRARFLGLKGRAAQIEEKAWREGSPRCLIPIAIKAGLVTWGVNIAATVISPEFSQVWQSLLAMVQGLKSFIAGTTTDSAVQGWSILPIRI